MKSYDDVKVLLYPMSLRVFHWSLVAGLSLAIISGLTKSLGIPLFTMRTGRLVHIISGLTALSCMIFRVGYGLITGDYRNFILGPRDFKTLPAFAKYYMFMEETPPPPLPKYNIGQKVTILSWLISVFYLSGVGILALNRYFADSLPALRLQRLILPQKLLVTKFYLSLYLSSTIFLHIYLAHTEDIAKTQSMITGWVRAFKIKVKK